ncbi:MAG: hypothetical protein ABL958_08960 [Bdellovibrionia bacterium]
MSELFPLHQLGFMGVLQVTMMIVFTAVGIFLLFFQRHLGLMILEVVFGLFAVLALVLGYSAYSFTQSVAEEALKSASPEQMEIIRMTIAEEAYGHWRVAFITVGVLAVLGAVAGVIELWIRWKRARDLRFRA